MVYGQSGTVLNEKINLCKYQMYPIIATASEAGKWYKIPEFLALDMTGKVLVSISFPERKGYTFRSFKVPDNILY